jgi:hypothetical protein
MLLNKDSERQRLVTEFQLRLQQSKDFLLQYRLDVSAQSKESRPHVHQQILLRDIEGVNNKHLGSYVAHTDDVIVNDFNKNQESFVPDNYANRESDDVIADDLNNDVISDVRTAVWRSGQRVRSVGPVDIAVTVLTMERGRRLHEEEDGVLSTSSSTGYLTQSVAALLRLLKVGISYEQILIL